MATDSTAHIAAIRQVHAATKDVSTKDIVDFLGDPAKVAALRNHLSTASEDDETGTLLTTTEVVLTIAFAC